MNTFAVKEYFFLLLGFPMVFVMWWSLWCEEGTTTAAFGAFFAIAVLFGMLFVLL